MPKIQMSFINGGAFIFNAEGKAKNKCMVYLVIFIEINNTIYLFRIDYMSIRREHRIVGKLIGCSSKWPRNTNIPGENIFKAFFFTNNQSYFHCQLGLPAIYSPYETQLLINKGIVQLCKKDLHGPPSDQIKQQYSDFLKGQAETFNDIYREKRVEETKKIMPKILEGKRKKVLQTGGNPDDVKEEDILNDVRKRCKFDEKTMFVQLPMQEPFPAGLYKISYEINRFTLGFFNNFFTFLPRICRIGNCSEFGSIEVSSL